MMNLVSNIALVDWAYTHLQPQACRGQAVGNASLTCSRMLSRQEGHTGVGLEAALASLVLSLPALLDRVLTWRDRELTDSRPSLSTICV
jgi:hypothetical protein